MGTRLLSSIIEIGKVTEEKNQHLLLWWTVDNKLTALREEVRSSGPSIIRQTGGRALAGNYRKKKSSENHITDNGRNAAAES